MSDSLTSDQNLRKAKSVISTVYLATEEGPAKDISETIRWLVSEVERLREYEWMYKELQK